MKLLPAALRDKPHYVFHPRRVFRRLTQRTLPETREIVEVELPWGLPLRVNTAEVIGFSIMRGDFFDLPVTEALRRLIDPGDLVVDVGANVGYFTSLAALCAGASGEVLAFEPHPSVFELLEASSRSWSGRPGVAPVNARRLALSDRAGSAELSSGPLFHMNEGLATLERSGGSEARGVFSVEVAALDEILGNRRVGLLKIDVEGHEPSVLAGAAQMLADGRVRDIVFEDHPPYPSEATGVLERAGYTLWSLANDLGGLVLRPPDQRGEVSDWPGPSYLATLDADRARARLEPRGWRVAGIGPPRIWPFRRAA